MSETQEQPVRLPYAIRISDFFVDFFGSLIPGIIFTTIFLLILVNLGLIILSICSACLPAQGTRKLSIIEQLITMKGIPEISVYFYFLFTIIFIVASYIFGFIFQRRGVRLPDEKSFLRVYNPKEGQSVHELNVTNVMPNKIDKVLEFFNEKILKVSKLEQKTKHNATDKVEYVDSDKIEISIILIKISRWLSGLLVRSKAKKAMEISDERLHWPYKDLGKFLGNRVPHLNSMVTWGNEKQRPPSRREINAVKEAIQFALPDNYAPIARQEGHARLISSIWFICRTFKRFSGIVFVVMVLFMLLVRRIYSSLNNYEQFFYLANIILNGTILLVASWVKIIIEKTFHYQRVRELLLILNIAYLAKADPKFAKTFWH